MANQPIIKKRFGRNSVAIFCDEKVTNDGQMRTSFSCSVQRSYKDKNNEWKESTLNCFIEDLLVLSCLLENSYIAFQNYLEDKSSNKASQKAYEETKAQAAQNALDDDIPF